MDYKPPLDLLVRYLQKECTATECSFVEAWLSEDEGNYLYLEGLEKEWVHFDAKSLVLNSRERKQVWRVIRSHIRPAVTMIEMSRTRLWISALAIASIMLLVGIGATFLVERESWRQIGGQQLSVVKTNTGQKSHVILPDGTKVWLNSGTKISYSNNFNQYNREVFLEGEAFFDVVHYENLPFTVNTTDIDVVVKGTAFDVSAYKDDTFTEVSLLEGMVEVYGKDGVLVKALKPNDLLRYDKLKSSYALLRGGNAEQYSTWTAEELVFENESLAVVIKKMERWYGVKIDWPYEGVKKNYTFRIKTESLREILQLINVITPIDYVIQGSDVRVNFR